MSVTVKQVFLLYLTLFCVWRHIWYLHQCDFAAKTISAAKKGRRNQTSARRARKEPEDDDYVTEVKNRNKTDATRSRKESEDVN